MSANDIKYRHAFDKNGEEWCIDDVKDKSLYHSLAPWHCILCGVEMQAGLGDIKRHYFKHKTETECNRETYLHKLAKTKLKKWFEKNQYVFKMLFKQKELCCEHSKCNFYDSEVCSKLLQISLSSENWGYSICNEEETVKQVNDSFRADLLIKRSELDDDPILIEVCVHHPSTQKKIESGLKIIEIQFDSEEEIEEFCKNNTFIEGEKVKFFGFKDRPSVVKDSQTCLGAKNVRRFTYKDRWHHFLDKSFKCTELHIKAEKDSEVELNLPDGSDSKWRKTALAFLWDYGYNPDPLYYGTAFRKFEYDSKNIIPVEKFTKRERPDDVKVMPKMVQPKKEVKKDVKQINKHSWVIPNSWPTPVNGADNVKRGVGNYPCCPIKESNLGDDVFLMKLYSNGLSLGSPFYKKGNICKNVVSHRYLPDKNVLYVMTDHRDGGSPLIYSIFKVMIDMNHNFVHIELESGNQDMIFPKFKSYSSGRH